MTQLMKKEIGCVMLHLEPLARTIRDNARSWVTSLGKLLNDSARSRLMQLKEQLEVKIYWLTFTATMLMKELHNYGA